MKLIDSFEFGVEGWLLCVLKFDILCQFGMRIGDFGDLQLC